MTNEEAKAEAIRRWGEQAKAVFDSQRSPPYYVSGSHVRLYGWGASWEEAFENATKAGH